MASTNYINLFCNCNAIAIAIAIAIVVVVGAFGDVVSQELGFPVPRKATSIASRKKRKKGTRIIRVCGGGGGGGAFLRRCQSRAGFPGPPKVRLSVCLSVCGGLFDSINTHSFN